MRITRKTNVFIKTERRLIVKMQPVGEPIYCDQCTGHMISAQASADLFSVSSREIYRLIDTERIHFVETKGNEIYVCPISVKRVLELMR